MNWATVVILYTLFTLSYFVAVNGFYLFQALTAFSELVRFLVRTKHTTPFRLFQSHLTPPVSVLMPAYGEEATIAESVRSMSLLRYPSYEIIVINDGSKDKTLQVLMETFELVPIERAPMRHLPTKPIRGVYRSPLLPNLLVVDKENGGKADALNVGIMMSRSPLFCAVDADSLLEPDALERVVQPFIEQPETTIASGGFIRLVNGSVVESGRVVQARMPRNLVALFQMVEYLRAFYLGRLGWNWMGGLLIISGAFGLFRTDVVANAGGYLVGSVGEDMELVVRIHRQMREQKRPYRVAFVPDPICWTEVPESLSVLGRQRNRWQRGLIDTLVRHRVMFLNARYGSAGAVAMPYFWFVEVLGPLFELSGYLFIPLAAYFGWINWMAYWTFLLLSVVCGMLLSVAAVLAEEVGLRRIRTTPQILALFGVAILENLGYRQLTTWWRLTAVWGYLKGGHHWGEMKRKGFTTHKSPN